MDDGVSVVIPCYDSEAYIGEAMASARAAGVAEIIVVDDGSHDVSAVRRLACNAGAILIRQERQGVAAARNAGIARAQGGFIGFLDADDLWPQASLSVRLAALAEDAGAAAAYGHVAHFLSPDLDAAARARVVCPTTVEPVRLCGAMLFRREVFERLGGFDSTLGLGETFEFVARFADAGLRAAIVPQTVLARRIHASNMTRDATVPRAGYLRAFKTVLDRRRCVAP